MWKRLGQARLVVLSVLGMWMMAGCSGGGGGSTPLTQTVTLQGRADDGLQNSPLANANCYFRDLQNIQHATGMTDGSGTFRLVVPLNVQGFLHCTPPSLTHLKTSAFVSTVGKTAGETIANLAVNPSTTLVAAVLSNTRPSDLQARAAALTAALTAGDADLTVLAQAATALYNAQMDNGIDIDFSSGSEGDAGNDGGSGDSGGTGGDAGDGGAFSPLPGATCDFALTMDAPALRHATLADLLADGTVGRPDLQGIASQVNTALAGK